MTTDPNTHLHFTPDLEDDLVGLMEVAQDSGTEVATQAFERLAIILTRPGKRVARAQLEKRLGRGQVDQADIDEVVNAALFQLYRSLGKYRPGHPVIPYFSTMVRSRAKDLVRKYRTRSKEPPDLIPLEECAPLVVAPDDLDGKLTVEEITRRLSAPARQLAELVCDGHTTEEIAMLTDKPVWRVRRELKKLREELGGLGSG